MTDRIASAPAVNELESSAAIDGNEAVASIAHRTNEVIAIYPITPASPMGEWADLWSHEGRKNIFGAVPRVIELQSEAGAAGTVHGALETGAMATTFTSSQGLLLMLPNMYKIAGELLPTVFHVAARAIATHALSIFGDHSDVMAARTTGFALLSAASVQEAMDLALIAQSATLEARVPFLHFFDGFRTSHEVATVATIPDQTVKAMIDPRFVEEHRRRALTPDRPVIRGTTQNPDVFFQGRERSNPFYSACVDITQRAMDRFGDCTGRRYRPFDYYGAPDAERVIVLMGSAIEAASEAVDHLIARGDRVGLIKVRLYRPFDVARFCSALPETTRAVCVLDRTKEPGSIGEPLYLDVVAALEEGLALGLRKGQRPIVTGGRYGLGSKELTPSMIASVFSEIEKRSPKRRFTLGIEDDVSGTSLTFDQDLDLEADDVFRAMFFGLASDGTVGANKSSIRIIHQKGGLHAQGYFVYDSKKSGTVTVSHLRLGPRPIRSTYLIRSAHLVACHHPMLLDRLDLLAPLKPGGTFLLNTPYVGEQLWETLPCRVQEQLIQKKARFFAIDASKVARDAGAGSHVNRIMQACFFAVSGILRYDDSISAIEEEIRRSYGKKGDEVVHRNVSAVERTRMHLVQFHPPESATTGRTPRPFPSKETPPEVRAYLGPILCGLGDALPVSAFSPDGTFATGTARFEKRNLAEEIPTWEPEICIQCGKCALVCPHAAIRIKAYAPTFRRGAPAGFQSTEARDRAWNELFYTIQVAPEDCTGCAICADICPARDDAKKIPALHMEPKAGRLLQDRAGWNFFRSLPEMDRNLVKLSSIRQQQVLEPLFEFSGACAGCGETPYLKLLSQLFGDRAIIANATGCSSIYGGNLPTTPWAKNAQGRGPAWANSLFEDNAEFGLGFRVSIDAQKSLAETLVTQMASKLGQGLADAILGARQNDEAGIQAQRERIAGLRLTFANDTSAEARRLLSVADWLVKKSVWIVGGDGWAYDIGFGGLDHVLASGEDVNVLVVDTEAYSNTGGQVSKATPLGAVAKFASGGKTTPKKDLGLMAMSYGDVYVASVAMGAKDEHTLKAFIEAESYPGPSLIIAYSHCIAHGIEMASAMREHRAAVESGSWLLYRHDPRRRERGKSALVLDSGAPTRPLLEYLEGENRFRMLRGASQEQADRAADRAQRYVDHRRKFYEYLAGAPLDSVEAAPGGESGRKS